MRSIIAHLVLAGLAASSPVYAAEAPVGVLDNPCASVDPVPAVVTAYMARVEGAKKAQQPAPVPTADEMKIYRDWQARLLVSDFAGRCHYDSANAQLAPTTPDRVVFFGDSITEIWGRNDPEFFSKNVVNRGVSGQTTSQMLLRFQTDVIALRPRAVHIIAGTNDIAGNTGPVKLAWVEANIEAMADMATAHGIKVILGATPPAARFDWRPGINPPPIIAAYNQWLRDFAARRKLQFVDYHAVLDDGKGGIPTRLSGDGVHPNADGYALMLPLARKAVAAATARR
jgi:lysophospholipase L1-like esterase